MHRYGFRVKPFPFDLTLLYGAREEDFPLEALAEFTRLGTWLLSPLNPTRIEWAAKTAVARAVRDTFRFATADDPDDEETQAYLQEVHRAHFSLREVSFGLLNLPGVPYWEEFYDEGTTRAETAIVIAATLLQLDSHSPNGLKPSMNRAVQQASFASEYSLGVSRQTAKDIWAYQAAAAPFLLAERWLTHPGMDPEIEAHLKHMVFVSPGDRDVHLYFEWLRSSDALRRFLSIAKFLQLKLSEILKHANAAKVQFAPFPEAIPAIEIDIPQFTAVELQRLSEYSARD